jgi:hypothetical protein
VKFVRPRIFWTREGTDPERELLRYVATALGTRNAASISSNVVAVRRRMQIGRLQLQSPETETELGGGCGSGNNAG